MNSQSPTVKKSRKLSPKSRGAVMAIRWIYPSEVIGDSPLDRSQTLGRDPSCSIVLDGEEVSRFHARIVVSAEEITLADEQSTNGTFVGGARIQRAALSAGSLIRVGEWIGHVVMSDLEPRTPRQASPYLQGSSSLVDILEPLERVSTSSLPILLEGETGVGKERVAQSIHHWSQRTGPYVAVNCAALPENLAEAELFGYKKGAFTGADRTHDGYFRAADGGTLLLDEILDLPAPLQPKLLRVLEESAVVPIGSTTPTSINVRVVAASQEPLAKAVSEKRFRSDLFARLNGYAVQIPPLRQRIDDIPALFSSFVREFASEQWPSVEPELIEALCLHDWPFNVRELRLIAKRAVALIGNDGFLDVSCLPPDFRTSASRAPASPQTPTEVTPSALFDALREHRGNVAQASKALGISRQRAYRLMQACSDFDIDAVRQADETADGQ